MTVELENKSEYVAEAQALLIEQFKAKPNFEALIAAFVQRLQELDDVLVALLHARWLDNATGVQLDRLGEIVGQDREGLEDEDYRVRLKVRIRLNYSSGLAEDIIEVFGLALGTTTPAIVLTERAVAAFTVELLQYEPPDLFSELLRGVRSVAVDAQLLAPYSELSEAFTLSDDANEASSELQGFPNAATMTLGGKLIGALRS